ncbi:MAG: NAD(P)/FAD-dependent oxidoreductase [Candidatus Promineifilaceae bacterium]
MAKKINVSNIKSGNPGVSGWDAILPPKREPKVLGSAISADWLIIGGGFTGLAAARRVSQNRPNDRTVLLEAIRIGEGSAGRSSGFMIDLPHDISAESYTSAIERDIRQTQMNRTALTFAAQAADEYGFSQEIFDPRGKVNVAADAKGDQHNKEYAEHLRAMGEKCTPFSAEEMRHLTGTPYYTSGLYTPGAIMIQPAGYVRAFAEGLTTTEAVDIYENSPVISMERQGDSWLVKTPQGSVSVPKIILAVNGHIQSFGFFKRRLMHVFLYGSLTRALTDAEVKKLGGEPTWEAVPADPMGSTMRRISGSGGHRILTRNRFRYSPSLEASEQSVQVAARDHDKAFKARFPMLAGVEQEYRWGGRLCLSWYSDPAFGEVAQGVYSACCQNGLGASLGTLSGILSADYATGVDNPYIADYLNARKPTLLPPEPFSQIGATAYLWWKERQAGREK